MLVCYAKMISLVIMEQSFCLFAILCILQL